MNNVCLIGRLTKEPEIRYTQTNNIMVANFCLAVNRRFVKENEEKKADFINIIAWNKIAEFVNKYIKKGQQIGIVGRIQSRNWEDEKGKHYATEVIAEQVYFADAKKETFNEFSSAFSENMESEFKVTDDDLPF